MITLFIQNKLEKAMKNLYNNDYQLYYPIKKRGFLTFYSLETAFNTFFLSALQSGAIRSFFAPSPVRR